MHEIWIPLNGVPAGGQEFIIDDATIWTTPLSEFGIPYKVTTPLQGTIMLLPQEDGCLVRGKLTGELVVPCDRCAEDATIAINHTFDSFEAFPVAEDFGTPDADELMDESIRPAAEGSGFELSISALLWEELLLALPVKPLCSASCKGICPSCGKNLNEEPCTCQHDEGDPRMAALRGLKIDKR